MRFVRHFLFFFQRPTQHLVTHPAQVQSAADHNDVMQPGHFGEDQIQAKQRDSGPHHNAHGDAEHTHHRFFAGTADGGLGYEEKVWARAHQRNDMHQCHGEKKH
ncbi:hypothetical protein D3C80_1845940 [compost metagenome]